MICEKTELSFQQSFLFLLYQLEKRLVDQERAQSSSSSSDDKGSEVDSTPNRVSEDIIKCLCSIFVRIGTFKDNLGEATSLSPCSKENDQLRDPYGICSVTKTRDIGAYNSLCVIKASTVDLNRMKNAVSLIHRLK